MSFGVNSLLLTTLQVAFGALFIAVPLGVGCAIYLSEYASPRLVAVVKPTLELLAGVPSVVYGFFAFIYIGPLVVEVGDYANFGGYAGVPQFRKIGAYTHIAAMSLVTKDVPAYMTVSGNPAYAFGMNTEGMKRRGYDNETIEQLKQAYRTVYRKGLRVQEALDALAPMRSQSAEVELFAASVEVSAKGIIRARSAN